MGPETYGPIQGVVNHGLSQTFDYGIGMTCLMLFLIGSIVLNYFALRFIFNTVAKLSEMIGELKEILHDHA